jgi:hypothetical protein
VGGRRSWALALVGIVIGAPIGAYLGFERASSRSDGVRRSWTSNPQPCGSA